MKGKLKAEKNGIIEVAKEMLKNGIKIENISKMTKLSIEEIENIKNIE